MWIEKLGNSTKVINVIRRWLIRTVWSQISWQIAVEQMFILLGIELKQAQIKFTLMP